MKPDLSAPGNKITGLAVPNSTLVKTHPELVTGTGANMRLTMSGTSQATAFVTGAVTLLEQVMKLTPAQVKARLQFGAEPMETGLAVSGAGSLNVVASLASAQGEVDDALRGRLWRPRGWCLARSEVFG